MLYDALMTPLKCSTKCSGISERFTGDNCAKIRCSSIFILFYDVTPELPTRQNNVSLLPDNVTTILWHDAQTISKITEMNGIKLVPNSQRANMIHLIWESVQR